MKRFLLLLVLFIPTTITISPKPVVAAVAYVTPASGASSINDGAVPSIAFSFNATGMDFILACAVVRDSDTAGPVVSFTYATSQNLTLVGSATAEAGSANFYTVYMYRLVAPTTGANLLSLTLTGSSDGIILGAMGFSGVHATVPAGTPATAASAGIGTADTTMSVSPASAADELTADCFGHFGTDEVLTLGTTQTLRFTDNRVGSNPQGDGSTKAGAAGTVTMQRNWTNFGYSALIGVSIKPAAAPSGVARRRIINQ